MSEKDKTILSAGSRDVLYNLFEKGAADQLNIVDRREILTWGRTCCIVTSKKYVSGWSEPIYVFVEEPTHSGVGYNILDAGQCNISYKGTNHSYTDSLIVQGGITSNSYTQRKICGYIFSLFCCKINVDKNNRLINYYDPSIAKPGSRTGRICLNHLPGCEAVIDISKGTVLIYPSRIPYIISGTIDLDKLTRELEAKSRTNKFNFDPVNDITWSVRSHITSEVCDSQSSLIFAD